MKFKLDSAYDDGDDGDDDDDFVVCRTHTLLLVDKAGTCEYVETTMGSDAISADHSFLPDKNVLVKGERPSDWRTSQFDFCFR